MRILLGLLGAIAFCGGAAIALIELAAFRRGQGVALSLLAGTVCAVAAVGGLLLMRGAIRGRIAVRRPGHRGPLL
jgi:hypothetical protein